jgi:RNA methyltransferase, TrmH family
MISRQQIKYITSLQQKKYRNEHKAYVIEGEKMVEEALHQIPERIELICYTSKYIDSIKFPASIASKVSHVSDKDFANISSLKNPQGILAVIHQPDTNNIDDNSFSEFILVLDSVRDPGNLGTIIRLCDWFGIHHIVCSDDTVDCFNPKVVQASMGAIFRVELKYIDLNDWLLKFKKNKNYVIYGATMDGANLYSTELRKPAILIMGNESNGISKEIQELLDQRISIPNQSEFPEKSESLNVSIATAIVCAEFSRQFN